MIAQTVDAADREIADAVALHPGQGRGEPVLKYRLDVFSFSTADVVRLIGGWLYDRTAAGWDVNVLSAKDIDTGPLRILGVQAADSNTAVEQSVSIPMGRGLVVSHDVFATDARVREAVLTALDRRMAEVTLIGEHWPLALIRRTSPVQHVLSDAARAFKGHALAAVKFSSTVEPIETLHSNLETRLPSSTLE